MLDPTSRERFLEGETDSYNDQGNTQKVTLKATVLRAQLISGAITMGVVMTSAVVLMLPANPPEVTAQPQSMLLIGCVVWAVSTLSALALPILSSTPVNLPDSSKKLVEQAIQDSSQPVHPSLQPLLRTWNTNLIVRAAMLEGAAVICLILWLITREITLLILVGASLSFMLITFPTFARFRRWLETRTGMELQ